MLILTRKTKETLVINDDIEVTIMKINGKQVRLGIKAPDDVTIYRKELIEKIDKFETEK